MNVNNTIETCGWRLKLSPGDQVRIFGEVITISEIEYLPYNVVGIVATNGNQFAVYLQEIK